MAYVVPQKTITDPEALQRFLESATCAKYVQFLEDLNESVKGKTNDAAVTSNEVCPSDLLFKGIYCKLRSICGEGALYLLWPCIRTLSLSFRPFFLILHKTTLYFDYLLSLSKGSPSLLPFVSLLSLQFVAE